MNLGNKNKAFLLLFLVASGPLFAKKGNRPVFDDSFDIAAGGANLTKATQLGNLFANPALLPFGSGFHRWAGLQLGLLASADSVAFAQNMASGGSSSSDELIDTVFKTPIHFGYNLALGYMNRNFGIAVFSHLEPDLRARRFGDSGLPEVDFTAESYHGAVFSLANAAITNYLSLGVTGKYLYVAEPDIRVEISNEEALSSLTSASSLESQIQHNTGFGTDVGALLFVPGKWLDYRLAAKVDDVGGTSLTGKGSTKSFKQVTSAGTSLTFHTDADALHLALDYRDITNAYEEEPFKKYYAGMKLTLRTYLGLAAGYFNGYPSYGAELDLIILRLSATSYTRELGDHPGVDPRKIYLVTLSMGY